MSETLIHRLVEQCRRDAYAPRIARLRAGWLVMAERQVVPGYCLLLPDPVVPHLNAFAAADRQQFLDDMALSGDALLAACGALRINYAIFGNVEPALHAHLFPRRADEAAELREAHPWALNWSAAPAYDDAVHAGLKAQVAQQVQRLAGTAPLR